MSSTFVVLVMFASVLVSALTAWLLLRTSDWHMRWTGDAPDGGPQKLHEVETTRIGGLAVAAGLLAGLGLLYVAASPALRGELVQLHTGWLIAALIPLLVLGVTEDITRRVAVRVRLVFGLVVAGVAYYMAGVQVARLDLPLVDNLMLSFPLLSFGFTLVAVCGLVHAMNIVDGLNGLLAGISLVALSCVSFVAGQHGETALMLIGLITIAATLGFGVFNFPRARIFCGDGGAYLLGYMLATLVILLVFRRPEISPWFAMAVIIHPVTETLYSAFRRWRDGLSPANPDAKHLHSLWAAHLRARESQTGNPVWLGSNAGAALRCAALAGVPCVLAAACATQTTVLQALCLVYVVAYLFATRLLASNDEAVVPLGTHRQPKSTPR